MLREVAKLDKFEDNTVAILERSFWDVVAQGKPCEEDATISLPKMTRQPTEKKTQKGGSAMTKKPRDLEPLVLENVGRRPRS